MFLTGIFNENFVTDAVLLLDGSVNTVSAGFDKVYTLQGVNYHVTWPITVLSI